MSRVGKKHVPINRFGAGMSPSTAAALNRMARQLEDTTRQAFTFDDRRELRGGGFPIKWVYVVGYAASNMKLSVKNVDVSGLPVGDPFEVWAVSYGQSPGTVGIIPLGQALPLFQATDRILIIRINNLVGGGKDWYTLATILRSCPAPPTAPATISSGNNGASAILPNPPSIWQKIGGMIFG